MSNYHVAIPWFSPTRVLDVTGTHPILWPEASPTTSPRALLEWNLPCRPLCAVCASFKTPCGMSSNVNNDGPGQQVLPCRNGQVPLVEVSFMVISKKMPLNPRYISPVLLSNRGKDSINHQCLSAFYFSLLELQNKCGKFRIWRDIYGVSLGYEFQGTPFNLKVGNKSWNNFLKYYIRIVVQIIF